MKLNREDYIEILETAMSWIVVLAMLVYGGGKIVQFTGMPYLNKPGSDDLLPKNRSIIIL